MANVTQLKHLEHIEDEMLNYGVEGCKSIVSFLKELRKMLGCDNSTGYMQTKWDGLPSVICGINPSTGTFFVGTKSVFNKLEPKMAGTDNGIEMHYGTGDLADKLKLCLKYFKQLGIKGVIQGDFIAAKNDIKLENVHGEKLYTFGNQAITYGIPVDHPLGSKIKNAEITVVFHTHYTGDYVPEMLAKPGMKEKLKEIKEVAMIDNDTPMHRIGLTHQEELDFDKFVSSIESNCKIAGEFLDELVKFSGTTGDAKWHVSSYVKQYFNSEIKQRRSITNVDQSFEALYNFYYDKTRKMLEGFSKGETKKKKRALVFKSQNYLRDNRDKWKIMLNLYKDIQDLKQLVIDKLDHLETFRTFARTSNGYEVTGPEGYVLHKDGDMVKLVNRLEFSYINFTLAKSWR